MKKVFALIAVLALTAPIMAADPNVVITCEDQGNGVVQVSYEVLIEDGVDPGLVRGFAFNIEADNGWTIDAIAGYDAEGAAVPADSENVAAGYSIYMGSVGFGTDPNTIDDYGDPVAPATDVDALGGLGTSGITVEMGSLYDPDTGTPPAASGVLFTITLTAAPETECCNLTITAEPTRGGIVMESGASANLQSTGCEVCIVTDCLKDTDPGYAAWVSYGKPNCWCYQRQCRGDVDGVKQLVFWVYTNDFTAFKDAFGKTDAQMNATRLCADLDHVKQLVFRVYTNDFTEFKKYFGKVDALVPVCDMTHINFWTN